MRSLFFYGTLRHHPLLDIVMGDAGDTLDVREAVLPDHAVFAVDEGPFPTILPQKGAKAQGLVVSGLTADHIARLDFYEGSFDYDLVPITLQDGMQTACYMSRPGRWTATQPWSLEAWIAQHGEMNNHAAAEVMSYYGHKSRDEVAALFPRIRARAGSKARAARSTHGALTYDGAVDIQRRDRAHLGFYALDTFTLRHALFDGTLSEPLEREVFVASDAACILPYDPARDCVLLVEQIRMGPLGRGDRSIWQLEPVAGLIDGGESPQDTAVREAFEEAGITITAVEPVAEVYPSPGNSTEVQYLYLGIADLPDSTAGIGGLASEGENIRSHILGFDALLALVESGGAANAPLVLLTHWLARHRTRLRSG